MLRPRHRSLARLAFVAALATVPGVARPAHAQDGGTPAPPPDTLLTPVSPPPAATPAPTALPAESPAAAPAAPATTDTSFTFPLLFDLRTRDEIQRDLDLVARMKAVAQGRLTTSRALQLRRKYDADIKGTEIDAAKKRVDLAKKEKRTVDAKSLDDARKHLEATTRRRGRRRARPSWPCSGSATWRTRARAAARPHARGR